MEIRNKNYRINKNNSKLKRKIKIIYALGLYGRYKKEGDFMRDVLNGEYGTWMRSVNRKCSCYLCKGYTKYKRPNFNYFK